MDLETRDILDRARIAGSYTTEQGNIPTKSTLDLQIESVLGALEDAGIPASELDGIVGDRSATASAASAFGGLWSESVGHPIRYVSTTDSAAGGHSAHILHAALAVATGLANVVAVIGGSSRGGGTRQDSVRAMAEAHGEFDASWGTLVPSWFAMVAQRHMHEFGTTSEQLAQVAVSTRQWASLNPTAIMRNPLTVDDVMNSRLISSPLHLFDCCLVNDGAGALIICRADRAADTAHSPVRVLGGAEEYSFRGYIDTNHEWLRSGAEYTGRHAREMAGLGINDIDLVEIYDCFTITVVRELEDLGFCARGDGGAFVADGKLGPGGALPTNTHGGGLSWGHTFSGLAHAIEATRQLQHLCGDRQVDAETALVHSQGGPLALHSTVILSN